MYPPRVAASELGFENHEPRYLAYALRLCEIIKISSDILGGYMSIHYYILSGNIKRNFLFN